MYLICHSFPPGIGTLSGLSGVDIKVIAGRGFAFLWETSANAVPDLDMMRTGAALCHNPHKVSCVRGYSATVFRD
jgi:hypothetical protein